MISAEEAAFKSKFNRDNIIKIAEFWELIGKSIHQSIEKGASITDVEIPEELKDYLYWNKKQYSYELGKIIDRLSYEFHYRTETLVLKDKSILRIDWLKTDPEIYAAKLGIKI